MKNENSVNHGGHYERLRKHFENDFDTLATHQIFEHMLSYVYVRKDVSPLAYAVLKEYETIFDICNASREDLMEIDGMTDRIADFIMAFPKFFEYLQDSKNKSLPTEYLEMDIESFIKTNERKLENDEYLVIGLDYDKKFLGHKVIKNDLINPDNTIKDILDFAYKITTFKILIVTKTSKEVFIPSLKDLIQTKNLIVLLRELNITLQDFRVISKNNSYSYKHEGIIDIIYAVKFNDENIFSAILNNTENKIFIMKKSSELMDLEISDEDKIIITSCQFMYNKRKSIICAD